MKKTVLIFLINLINICAFAQTYPSVTLTNSGDGASLLNFSIERPWLFKQVGTGAYTHLQLHNYPGPNKYFQIKTDGGLQLINQSDNLNSHFSANGGNSYIGNLGGFLGVGTTSPSTKLHVVDNINGEVIRVESSSSSSQIKLRASGSGGADWSIMSTANGASLGGGKFSIYGNAQHRFVVDQSGNVGIGTTSPTSKLDIKGSGDGTELLRLSTERPWVFRQVSTGATSQLDLHSTVSSKNFKITSLNNNRAAQFLVSDNSNDNRVFLVPDGGNVSIGSTDFGTHRLAVEGSIGAREIKVEASGWSDFVFENDYDLRTLEEVEQHINDNGHLPEIPSAEEVSENGINLGEMDAKLLQKVEELTLYIIEMNKRVGQLETENTELKEKVQSLENE